MKRVTSMLAHGPLLFGDVLSVADAYVFEPGTGNGGGGDVPSPEEAAPIDDGTSGCSVRAPGASEPSGRGLAAWLRRRRR